VRGTGRHVAPEVLEGDRASVASDIYSLGSTLATLALGRVPFVDSGDDTVIPMMMRIAREPLPDLRAAGIDDRVAAAIEMAMAKSPDERFGSAAAFGNALQQIERRIDLPVTPMQAERPTIPPVPPGRQGGPPPAMAATAVAPVVTVLTTSDERPPDPREDPPRRRGALPVVAGIVLLGLAAAVAGFLLARRDDGGPAPARTTTTTSTVPPATPSTRPLPGIPAQTVSQATAAAEAYRGLGLDVVDNRSYRGVRGLSVLVARVPDARQYLVVFYDGHLIGLDWSEPSWQVTVTDVTADAITVDYGLFAAGQRPPSPTIGTKRIVFAWNAESGQLIPENGPAPPTDQGVDGHR
jgi:hypothetical protein